MRGSRRLWSAAGLAILASLAAFFAPNVSIRSDLPATAATAAIAFPSPNLIDNGDLEAYFPRSRPRLWELDVNAPFLWDETSRGPGDRSLFLDASTLIPRADASSPSLAPPPATIRCPIPSLAPGAAYLVSLWMARDPNIDGLYPSVSLGGRDFRLSDLWASGSWQKISLVVLVPRLLPPDARRLEIRIPAGDYRLWIDDLVVRRLAIDAPPIPDSGPIAFSIPSTDRLLDIRLVFSRRARGRLTKRVLWTNNVDGADAIADENAALGRGPDAGGGSLAAVATFNAVATIAAADAVANGSAGLGSARGADSSSQRHGTAPVAGLETIVPISKVIFDPPNTTQSFQDERTDDPSASGIDRFSIERDALATALPPGRWKARLEVYRNATLQAAAELGLFNNKARRGGSADSESYASAHDAGSKISTPKAGRLLLHGERASDPFPIGIFGARPEDFAALAEAGFNAAFFSASEPAQIARGLAQASRHGLSLLVPHAAAEGVRAALDAAVRPSSRRDSDPSRARDDSPREAPPTSPSLYFYLDDEPEGRSVSPKLLIKSRNALRRLGFDQPGAIALCRSWRAADYASAVDVFMANPYPVPFEPLSWLAQSLDEVRETLSSSEPPAAKRVWAVIQAFGWDSVSDLAKERGARPPTPAELKALVRLALLHGADGLFFYSLRSREFNLRENEPLWDAVKESIVEARTLKALLDAPLLSPAPKVYCPSIDAYSLSAVHFKAIRPPSGPPLLLALNTLDRPVQAAIHVPGRVKPIPFALEPLDFEAIELQLGDTIHNSRIISFTK